MTLNEFDYDKCTMHEKLFMHFGTGYKQFHPLFMNVVVDTKMAVHYVPLEGLPIPLISKISDEEA